MIRRLCCRRVARLGAAATAMACLAACSVGAGTGLVEGTLYVKSCNSSGTDRGSPDMPEPFRLEPRFFGGDPIEGFREGGTNNRLIIRLQSSGRRLEAIDVLTFDVISSYHVARCVRGLVLTAPGEVKADYDPSHCSWGPDGQGPPRVRIGPDQPIRVNFAPRATCVWNTHVVASALDTGGRTKPSSEWDSWIEFDAFGSAGQPNTAADQREPIRPGFKIEFNERLHASKFHLTMTDDRTVKARSQGDDAPDPEIGGVFEGFFDFHLQRGQGSQTLP
jgi:hypothetical protein